MTPDLNSRTLVALALFVALTLAGCGASLSPGTVSYEQTSTDAWKASIVDASAEPDPGTVVRLSEFSVSRTADAFDAALDIGLDKNDVTIGVDAGLSLDDFGGDATLSASVAPTEGRSVAIDTDASWSSPQGDLDGGLMALGTCAAIGTSDEPVAVCVRYEAGDFGGADTACVSYGDGVNLCFPLPDAWQNGPGEDARAPSDDVIDGGRAPAIPDAGQSRPDIGTEPPTLSAAPRRAPALPHTLSADAG